MKKIALFLAAVLMLTALSARGGTSNGGGKSDGPLDLDGYILEDPDGVEFETRTVLYKPCIAGDGMFEQGAVTSYAVYYITGDDGKCMVNLIVFDTEEHAAAYGESPDSGNGEVEGNVFINVVYEEFFIQMASFIPTIGEYIDTMMASGYMEVEE